VKRLPAIEVTGRALRGLRRMRADAARVLAERAPPEDRSELLAAILWLDRQLARLDGAS
jgi:hypothetical protein